MKLAIIGTLAIASLGLSACVVSDERTANDPRLCISPGDITNWGGVDALLFHVRTRDGRVFQGRLRDVCPQVDYTREIQIRPAVRSRRICPGSQAMLVIPDPTSNTTTCFVEDFRALSDEEIAALPADRWSARSRF